MQHIGLQHQGGTAPKKQTALFENKSTYAFQRFVGMLVAVSRLITKWDNEPRLCDSVYSFIKAYKIYGNNQFAETIKNPSRIS